MPHSLPVRAQYVFQLNVFYLYFTAAMLDSILCYKKAERDMSKIRHQLSMNSWIFYFSRKQNEKLYGMCLFWELKQKYYTNMHIDGLVQDCSNSSALAIELLQSCTKPSIYLILVCNVYFLTLNFKYSPKQFFMIQCIIMTCLCLFIFAFHLPNTSLTFQVSLYLFFSMIVSTKYKHFFPIIGNLVF